MSYTINDFFDTYDIDMAVENDRHIANAVDLASRASLDEFEPVHQVKFIDEPLHIFVKTMSGNLIEVVIDQDSEHPLDDIREELERVDRIVYPQDLVTIQLSDESRPIQDGDMVMCIVNEAPITRLPTVEFLGELILRLRVGIEVGPWLPLLTEIGF